MSQCTARNRSGQRCKRAPQPGSTVCYYHGGAPGSGAPIGNQNAIRHGFYSNVLTADDRAALAEAEALTGIDAEIALLRVKLRRAAQLQPDNVDVIIHGLETIARALLAKHRLTGASRANLDEALSRVLLELTNEIGLTT